MKNRILKGTISHKRRSPKKNSFEYPFFMIDFETQALEKLKNRYFSLNRFNLFSFYAKDHFGQGNDFQENVQNLLKRFEVEQTNVMRFITLPRIFGFVFNPISLLLLYEEETPKALMAEVHNYNGGRIVYYVPLQKRSHTSFYGRVEKQMYVSPFLSKEGEYEFIVNITKDQFLISVNLIQNSKRVLCTTFKGFYEEYEQRALMNVLFSYGFLTLKVVTRTLWQTLVLKLKGLKWYEPELIDQSRRF